jgi:hypothetical protein
MFDYQLPEITLPVENIFLDIFNPRFSGEIKSPKFSDETKHNDPRAQELTRRFLFAKHGAGTLADSIARVGFLKIDRVIVRKITSGVYVVVEGNRRLAAVKTILGDVRRKVIDIPTNILDTLHEIEVLELKVVGDSAVKAASLLQGIRHISGVRNWGPYQQGKLVKTLVEDEGLNFSEAALSVGLSPSRVAALLRGYYGLRQMQNDPCFGAYADVSLFSHFEQAHLKIPVRKWLDWDDSKKEYCNVNALEFLYSRITDNPEMPALELLKASEIRDLLPAVLENEEARQAYLSSKSTLVDAYAITQPDGVDVTPFLQTAVRFMSQFKGDDSAIKFTNEERAIIEQVHTFSGKILQQSVCW